MNSSYPIKNGIVVVPLENHPIFDYSNRLWSTLNQLAEEPQIKAIVINCEHRTKIDFMEALTLNTIATKMKKLNKQLAICFQDHKCWNDFRLSQIRGIVAMYSSVDEALVQVSNLV